MPSVVIYHHDPVEVDPATSWTGLCPPLVDADLRDISAATDERVTQLFDYARPDAVITVDGSPVVSIEQTQMNPSGHNIPQRFSCLVRASELGVPSILYYPEYSRRTFSDPNVRYLNIRVPLAQIRLSRLFDTPSLSMFWPTNDDTLLPDTAPGVHRKIATVVDSLVSNAGDAANLLRLRPVQDALADMDRVISTHQRKYRQNASVRGLMPQGFPSATTEEGFVVDPPNGAALNTTVHLLDSLSGERATGWPRIETHLRERHLTLVYTGTANGDRTDSEHPWPGYLTLLDILYARVDGGRASTDRAHNLVYRLPVDIETFLLRANRPDAPTPTYIVDTFADLVLLDGGVVPGRPMRGDVPAHPLLTY